MDGLALPEKGDGRDGPLHDHRWHRSRPASFYVRGPEQTWGQQGMMQMSAET